MKRLIAEFKTYTSFNDIIKHYPKIQIINLLYEILIYFINSLKFYQYVIDKHQLTTLKEATTYFKHVSSYNIINYLNDNDLWKQVASRYCMLSQNMINNMDSLGKDIYAFIKDNPIILWKLNDNIEDNFVDYLNRLQLSDIINARKLKNINDKKGDDVKVFRVDIGNRDGIFVDIDGTVINSTMVPTHNDLINQYLEQYNEKLKIPWLRPSLYQIKKYAPKANIQSIAFGHICNGIYLIDTVNNMNINTVIEDLKRHGISGKIYWYKLRSNHGTVKRLAKKRI